MGCTQGLGDGLCSSILPVSMNRLPVDRPISRILFVGERLTPPCDRNFGPRRQRCCEIFDCYGICQKKVRFFLGC